MSKDYLHYYDIENQEVFGCTEVLDALIKLGSVIYLGRRDEALIKLDILLKQADEDLIKLDILSKQAVAISTFFLNENSDE